MNFHFGPLAIPEEVAECSRRFQQVENEVREYMRPALKGIEASNWERVHSYLLDILIEGNEIANRTELYREIGRMSAVEARRLSHKIENHIEDILVVQSILEERSGSEDHLRILKRAYRESVELLSALKLLRNPKLEICSGC